MKTSSTGQASSKKTVLILFGGESSEHKISRISASSVLSCIDRERYDVLTAGITEGGSWLLTGADLTQIRDGSWEQRTDNHPLVFSMDREHRGLLYFEKGQWKPLSVDVVFPILHGKNGEDGTVQGLLQMAGIPFVGSDAKASAACMDKAMTKALIEQAGVAAMAKCCVIHRTGCDPEEAAEAADAFFRGDQQGP